MPPKEIEGKTIGEIRHYLFEEHLLSPFFSTRNKTPGPFLPFFDSVIEEVKEKYPGKPIEVCVEYRYFNCLNELPEAVYLAEPDYLIFEDSIRKGFLDIMDYRFELLKREFCQYYDRKEKCSKFWIRTTDGENTYAVY